MNAEFVLSTGYAKVVGTDFGDGDAEDFGVRGGLGRQTWQAAVFIQALKANLGSPASSTLPVEVAWMGKRAPKCKP